MDHPPAPQHRVNVPKFLAKAEADLEMMTAEEREVAMRYLVLRFGPGTVMVTAEPRPMTERQIAARRAGGLARAEALASRAAGRFTSNGPAAPPAADQQPTSKPPAAAPAARTPRPAKPPAKPPAAAPAADQQATSNAAGDAVVSPVVPVVLPAVQLRETTRETGRSTPVEPGVKRVIDHYHTRFVEAFTEPGSEPNKPHITGKDGALVKTMIQRHGVTKVLDMVDRLFESDDPFIVQAGRTLPILSSQWNKLAANGHGPGLQVPAAVRRSMEAAGEVPHA